ncbi:uncharacterized protein BJX67DRAFT_382083 [Aspergillus lucknowensis]|uniref:Uncharacterized protein n=1 Tax=Aspergillus lucknowensis TaxID=176173 RepID=A0ABR4LSC2_9EURO
MAQSTPQPNSDLEPLVIAIFPWICMGTSLLFIATFYRKHIAELGRFLFPPKLREISFGAGLTGRIKGKYARLDREHAVGDGGVLMDEEFPRAVTENDNSNYDASTSAKARSGSDALDGSSESSSLSKYFNGKESILRKDILLGEALPTTLPKEADNPETRNEDQEGQGKEINRRVRISGPSNADINATTDLGAGWMHDLVEVAVRGLQRLS